MQIVSKKMPNVPFENNRTKTKDILKLIHTDLNVLTEQRATEEKNTF